VMTENVIVAADALCTEALMLALAPDIGKQSAHALIYDLAHTSTASGQALREAVSEDPRIRSCLSAEEIEGIFDPTRYTGRSAELVDASVERAVRWLAESPDPIVLHT